MQKLFIDCSFIYEHPELNTGIQRVVRKVIENLELLKEEQNIDVTLVTISNNQFSEINIDVLYNHAKSTDIEATKKINYKKELKEYLKNLYRAVRGLIVAIFPFPKLKSFLLAPREQFGLNHLIHKVLIQPFKQQEIADKPFELEVSKGDILLLLDSTWHLDIWSTVDRLKQQEVKVISIIYDLIPLTYPQFCDDFLVKVFKEWFANSINLVDGYIAISHTVEKDLITYLNTNFGTRVRDKKFDHFILGSDFNYTRAKDLHIRENIKEPFLNASTYLIVSTLEPRKNHKYLLDVFDKLWEQNISVNLCIVGRIGWKVEELMNRIKYHKECNHRLFHYDDLNDNELIFCYQNSKALLFPSIVEGFGLPIVESLTHHLPVFASDTPIHREVGGDKIGYFDLKESDDLVDKIIEIETKGIPKELIPSEDYRWIDWSESTNILLDKMNKMTAS